MNHRPNRLLDWLFPSRVTIRNLLYALGAKDEQLHGLRLDGANLRLECQNLSRQLQVARLELQAKQLALAGEVRNNDQLAAHSRAMEVAALRENNRAQAAIEGRPMKGEKVPALRIPPSPESQPKPKEITTHANRTRPKSSR